MSGTQEKLMFVYALIAIAHIGIEKKCRVCGETKNVSEYYINKRDNAPVAKCKLCHNKMTDKWAADHREEMLILHRRWRSLNPGREKPSTKEQIARYNKQGANRKKEWAGANKERLRPLKARWMREKLKDPKWKLAAAMKNRMWRELKGAKNGRHWETLVGYPLAKLIKHLEKQFITGMTWENYGSYWHVDHIIPVAAFNFCSPSDIDFQKCWSLNNLQPLEAKKNFSKADKLDKPFQPSFTI